MSVACAEVVAHNRQCTLIESKDRHENKGLQLKVNAQNGDRGLGELNQDGVHACRQHRGQTLHDDAGQADLIDRTDHAQVGLPTAHTQREYLLMNEHTPQTNQHTDNLTDDGCERCTANAHLRERSDAEDEQRVQNDVDDCTGQTLTHRNNHITGRLLNLLAHDGDHDKDTQSDRDVRIADRLLKDGCILGKTSQERTAAQKSQKYKHDTAYNGQYHAVFCRIVGLFLILCTQTARDQRVDTDTGADRNCDDQLLKRKDQRNGGQCTGRVSRDENTVDDIVERIDEHGNHSRQGHAEDERSHAHGAHFLLRLQKNPSF